MKNPVRYFKTSPEVIRLEVMMYVRYPLSLRRVEDPLHERGIDIRHETVRARWNRVGPMFAAATDMLRSYRAAMKAIGNEARRVASTRRARALTPPDQPAHARLTRQSHV